MSQCKAEERDYAPSIYYCQAEKGHTGPHEYRLDAPPHGKDAGEWKDDWRVRAMSLEIDLKEALQRRDNFRDHCERLEAQRDALHARLTEAEGLLRECGRRGGDWDARRDAFLKGGTP